MPDTIEAHLYVLPWLQLRRQIDFGRVSIAPAKDCLDSEHLCRDAAQRILACYRGLGGSTVSPCLMWMSGDTPLSLVGANFDELLIHRLCLSAALIMANEYFDTSGIGPTNDAHCDGYFHRFASDSNHVSIYKRRREGQYLDGWPVDKLAITVALSASAAHQIDVDHSVLDALVTAISSSTPLGELLERALPPFVQGNRLSEQTTVLDDLVWMGSALERLFAIGTPIGENLAASIESLFNGYTQSSTTWNNTTIKGQLRPDSGPWRKRWGREFYARRSALHSGTATTSVWSDLHLSVIAAELFSLAVIRKLEDAGVRPLTDKDKLRLDALDSRIEVLGAPSTTPGESWHNAFEDALQRFTSQI